MATPITGKETVEEHHLLRHFRRIVLLRKFDETVDRLYGAGKIFGTTHLYIGQEAIASGVCEELEKGDVITSTHRGHGHSLAIGSDPRSMFAEILGRQTGVCGGYGGSMHVAERSLGNLGANGIVGAGVPIATGAALRFKLLKSKNIAVAFTGDGALNEGCVHEAFNLAAIWTLPIVIVVENNQYALSSPVAHMFAIEHLAARGAAYGIPSLIVDGQDVSAVQGAAKEAFQRARAGDGPTLLEMKTYRYRGHSKNDPARYRSREEVAEWRKRDPIELLRTKLLRKGIEAQELQAIEAEVESTVTAAASQADLDPFPHPEDLCRWVYSEDKIDPAASSPIAHVQKEMSFAEAIRWTLQHTLENDSNAFLIGEDIGRHGGSFGVTRGLYELFGSEKVRDTPISEAAIVGMGIGAAVMGARPIVEIQFSDFLANAMDAIVNQAAKIHFMSGGTMSVPVVIRTPMGGGIGMAAQHSQCLESWFYHIPGLKIAVPSTPDDARGLLLSAVRDNNPVIFLEHKGLYSKKGLVSLTSEAIPFGRASVRRIGSDATVVTYSAMVDIVLSAATILSGRRALELEVIDLRTLTPLDWATIEKSVFKTGRLAVCHEAVERGGVGGDIVARAVSGPAFKRLRGTLLRIGAVECPVPYSRVLENRALPSIDSVAEQLEQWLYGGANGS